MAVLAGIAVQAGMTACPAEKPALLAERIVLLAERSLRSCSSAVSVLKDLHLAPQRLPMNRKLPDMSGFQKFVRVD